MKTSLQIFISVIAGLLLPWSTCCSQSIVNPDYLWSTVALQNPEPHHHISSGSLYHKFLGDTIVDGLPYLKVFECSDSLMSNWQSIGIIREENRKVYYRDRYHDYDVSIYDFNLALGDTFIWNYFSDGYLGDYIVESVDSVFISGVYHKRIKLFLNHFEFLKETWIEGIGSLEGVLFSCNLIRSGATLHLLCKYDKGNLVYHNENFEKCFYAPAEYNVYTNIPMNSDQNLQIFPNPFNDQLNIHADKSIIKIQIMDMQGRIILQQISPDNSPINTTNILPGMYLLRISFNNTISISKNIIKISR